MTPLDVDVRARHLLETTLDNPEVDKALQSFGIHHQANTPWSLDQLTIAAWGLRPEIKVVREEIKAALAAKQLANERPNPVFSLTPEYIINAVSGAVPWVVTLAADFLTQTGGKRSLANLGAEQDILIGLAGSDQVFWNIRVEVSQAVVNIITADTANEIALDNLILRKAYRDWVQRKLAAGSLARSELLRAEFDQMAAQSQASQAAGEVIMAQSQLANTLGVPIEAISGVTITPLTPDGPPAPSELDQRELRERALINRADIRHALAEYGRADVDFRIKVAGRYPDLTLSPATTYDSGSQKISLGVSAELPLFHDQSVAISLADAQRAIAASHFDTIQTQALAAIDTAFAAYKTSWVSWQQAEKVVAIQQQLLTQASKRFENGATDKGDLMAYQLSALQSRGDAFTAHRTFLNASLLLENAIQRPLWPATQLTIPNQKDRL